MAHMTDGKGPYPDLAGEFCGNHDPVSMNYPAPCMIGKSQIDANRYRDEWLSKMRFGKPANCDHGTSGEMTAQGWVGLYLQENRDLHHWETRVETDELTEAVVTQQRETQLRK